MTEDTVGCEMAQSVKALAHKPVDLSLIFDLYILTTACVTPVIINSFYFKLLCV